MLREAPKVLDPNLLVGTETSDDAGVYRLTHELALVQTVDFFAPLVDDPFVFGQIAASNALSDVYAMGGTPKTALNILAFPDDQLSMNILQEILRGGQERAKRAGCIIVGGHTIRDTEIKYGLAVTGLVNPNRVVTNAGCQIGDRLVLTKPLGTGFVTTAYRKGKCSEEATLKAAIESMIQLNEGACKAMVEVGVHAATDITGFGLAGHAFHMAKASRTELSFFSDRFPKIAGVEPLIQKGFRTRANATNRSYVSSHLRIAPGVEILKEELFFDAQTSGGLLISVPESRLSSLVSKVLEYGAMCAIEVGRVNDSGGEPRLSLIKQ